MHIPVIQEMARYSCPPWIKSSRSGPMKEAIMFFDRHGYRRSHNERHNIMRKLGVLLLVTLLAGCAGNAELIRANSSSSRTDVYSEEPIGVTIPQGFVDLRVTASLKTHKPG